MTVAKILNTVSEAQGSNAKLKILRDNKEVPYLRKVLEYGLDPYRKFGVVKVPQVEKSQIVTNDDVWFSFFEVADLCANRQLTGNKAIDAMSNVFSQADESTEMWMRQILKKHFNIGVGRKTAFKVYENLTRTFSVQLASKWNANTIKELPAKVRIEPKLDGIRMVAIVEDGNVEMFSRAGKPITNFNDTVGKEISTFPNGIYDGEVMDDDFIALMRQVHRKKAKVTNSYFMVFDTVTHDEWDNRQGIDPLSTRRKNLEACFQDKNFVYLRLVEHKEINTSINSVMSYHKECTDRGFEGAMLKNPDLPYNFGRSDAVVKVKMMNDADLKVIGFKEGRGKNKGTLGAIVVDYDGVEVNVGSGFDDETRDRVWFDKDKYLGMIAEVQYQEVTVDRQGNPHSLRFPVFLCWRLDK